MVVVGLLLFFLLFSLYFFNALGLFCFKVYALKNDPLIKGLTLVFFIVLVVVVVYCEKLFFAVFVNCLFGSFVIVIDCDLCGFVCVHLCLFKCLNVTLDYVIICTNTHNDETCGAL